MRLKNRIESIIKAAAANPGTETRYREPIVGYASTDDPIFDEMKKITLRQERLSPSFCLLKRTL